MYFSQGFDWELAARPGRVERVLEQVAVGNVAFDLGERCHRVGERRRGLSSLRVTPTALADAQGGDSAWAEYDEHHQFLFDGVEAVGLPGADEEEVPRTDCAVLRTLAEPGAASNDVVDLGFPVGRLRVGASRGKNVHPGRERRDPEELAVPLATPTNLPDQGVDRGHGPPSAPSLLPETAVQGRNSGLPAQLDGREEAPDEDGATMNRSTKPGAHVELLDWVGT